MIPLAKGWKEVFGLRPSTGEQAESYAWCDGDTNTITYYWGWWILFHYWTKFHERFHAATRYFRDCFQADCIMSVFKGWRVYRDVLIRRVRTGSWLCPDCQARLSLNRKD